MNILDIAIAFAAEKHRGTFDKGGMPYILHPLKVMYYLKTDDQELMAIAVLHDVVEDCKVSYADLREIGMTNRVVEGVKSLTRLPGETYDEFIERIKLNKDAVLVKLQDLRHNSDIRRLKGVRPSDIQRTIKYHKCYTDLLEVVKQF